MGKAKIVYRDWIVRYGADPCLVRREPAQVDPVVANAEIVRAVRAALEKLPPFQKELIERYYFLGSSCIELASDCNLKVSEVQAYLGQAVKSLKKSLNSFVRKKFGLVTDRIRDCPVCSSPFRESIDRLILARKPNETWKNIIRILKRDFGVFINTPQVLIGHKKYHMKREV
jgi:hypothetical protein